MRLRPFLFVAALSSLLCSSPVNAATLKGVDLPDTLDVDGQTLKLQGMGLRKKFLFSVYVGALYLVTPTPDADAAIGADEPKRISMHFVRDVGADNIREAFEEGFFNNSQEKLDRLRTRIDRLLSLFNGGVRKGTEVSFTYLPGEGTQVSFDGTQRAVLEGRDFMEALWAIWLGEVPADYDLKRGMLGL